MGADIHSFAERKVNNKWVRIEEFIFGGVEYPTTEPFGWRSYAVFGFLANVRNYSCSECISELKGLPDDSEYLNNKSKHEETWTMKDDIEDNCDYHSLSWLSLKELLDFDYDKKLWDRRVMKQIAPNVWSGGELAEEGEGIITTYRKHLGSSYFNDLEVLKSLGEPEDVRIVFWFDN